MRGSPHIYSRGQLGLVSVREGAPNPQETGCPRGFRDLVGWSRGVVRVLGTSLWRLGLGGRRYVKWNSQSADDENKIWSAKIERYSIYFLRNHQTDFQNGCTILQFHKQLRNVPPSPHPCQHLLSHEFLTLAILTGVR